MSLRKCISRLFCGIALCASVRLFAEVSKLSGSDLFSGHPISIDVSKAEKATVILFMSSKCPCSMSHEAEIKALAKEYSKEGFSFFIVHSNADESESLVKDHFKQADLGIPVVKDSDYKIANSLGAMKTPHVFIISPKGQWLYTGAVSNRSDFSDAKNKYLRTALKQIVDGIPVDPNKTMSIGCAIRS